MSPLGTRGLPLFSLPALYPTTYTAHAWPPILQSPTQCSACFKLGLLPRPHELGRRLLQGLSEKDRRTSITQHPSIPPGEVILSLYWVQTVRARWSGRGVLRNGDSAPYLDAVRDVVNNEYSPTVFVAWEGHVEPEHLHLPPRLRSSLLPIDGLARRTLHTPILERADETEGASSPSPQDSHVQMARLTLAPCSLSARNLDLSGAL